MELKQDELVLYHTDVDGLFVRIFLPGLFGVLALGAFWLVWLWVTALPSASLRVVASGRALWPATLLSSWLAMRLTVAAWRSGRGHWWLRLTSRGFEINERVLAARHHDWREIDRFMLVAPSAQDAVMTQGETFADVLRDGDGPLAFRLGYRCVPGHRRRFTHLLYRGLQGTDGAPVDGLVMGYWDRPSTKPPIC
jgi:hypothetical protein